ncbi:MAG: HDIG domain-containing protein [bacterium]|nr:HDIG domain-containing protein [bacterium]
MELKSILPENEKSLQKPLYSFALSLIGAVSSELILSGFLETGAIASSFGRVSVVAIALFVVHRFALESLYTYRPRLKDLLTLTAVLVGTVAMGSLGKLLSLSLLSYFKINSLAQYAHDLPAESLYYAIPFAAGGILVQAVMGIEFALVFGVGLALIVGIYFPEDLVLPSFVIATTFIGSLGMTKVRSRSAYIKAGANVAIVTGLFSLARLAVHEESSLFDLFVGLGVAAVGGMLCSFVVAGVAPVIEYLGGYVTDITLLEIATLDHPLLKQLSIQAPGTWNHSMVMGMMVESAAQAIGANAVLGRVSCYYHDIGKTKNPLYFIENQMRGENRHDKLSPSMSALIIKSHVKDGIKMAQEHKLPQAIIDMIPQHHGTSLIEYFYDKAGKEAEEAGLNEAVDVTLYMYPGPKPQTKEAGIIMLADGIEAASRTIADPSHDRIQGLVQKMINKVFATEQLEECELTLKELHEIAKCFTRVLSGIYHQRIQYSEPAEKAHEKIKEDTETETSSEGISHPTSQEEKPIKKRKKKNLESKAIDAKEISQDQDKDKESKDSDGDDLKRLGI